MWNKWKQFSMIFRRNKILINALLNDKHYSGVHYYFINLINAINKLSNNDLDIEVLTSRNHALETDNLKVNKLDLNTANRILRIGLENFWLDKYFKKNNFSIYHSTTYVLPYFWNAPSVLTVHDLIALNSPEYCSRQNALYYKKFLPQSILKAKRIIAVSSTVKRDILEKYDIDPEKIEVVYHGVDPRFKKVEDPHILSNIRKQYRLPDKFILFVGNLEPKKNLERLIEAYGKLKSDSALDHKLVIAGHAAWKFNTIFKKVEALKLSSSVIFLGYVDEGDLPSIYSLTDLFVFPSLYEGFGLPVLEAMACETPVVCSKKGALPEVTGNLAAQVDPYSIADMAEKMYHQLNSKDPNKVKKSREWASGFTWEKTAKATIDVYEKTYSEIY
jgi:glycosyltransferase involved in cell wall biosynthesis